MEEVDRNSRLYKFLYSVYEKMSVPDMIHQLVCMTMFFVGINTDTVKNLFGSINGQEQKVSDVMNKTENN